MLMSYALEVSYFFSSTAIISAEHYRLGGPKKTKPNNIYTMQRCGRGTWGTCTHIPHTYSMYGVSGQGWYIRDRGSLHVYTADKMLYLTLYA